MRDCQLSWRCELRVSPHSCLAMRWAPCAPCAEVVELTLCSIKCVEAIAACAKSQNGPSPLCLFQCWSESPDFWSRDLAVTASDDRGSGEIAPGTPKEAHISGGWEVHSIHRTQKHWSVEFDDAIVLKPHCSATTVKTTFILFFYLGRAEVLGICKLLNFLKTFSCQLEKKKLQLKVWLSRCHPPVILLSPLNQSRLFFFLTHGGGIEHGDVCGMVTCNSRVKAAWKNPFSV